MTTAMEFHRATKHDPDRLARAARAGEYRLDFSNVPSPYRDYPDLDAVALPHDRADTGVPALEALSARRGEAREPLGAEIAQILHLGTGVIRTLRDREFRSYASAGALYPNEVYLACAGVEGIEPGLYHYHPAEHLLRVVRRGDPMPALARATGAHPAVSTAPAALIVSAVPWRTTWKYRDRGYRHVWWDAGTMTANVLALAGASGLRAEVVLGFADAEVDALIGADGREEMAAAIVPIGGGRATAIATAPPERVAPRREPLSRAPMHLDLLLAVHAGSALADASSAADWRVDPPVDPAHGVVGGASIEDAIRARGSARRFALEAVPAGTLEACLAAGAGRAPGDWSGPALEPFVVAHDVEGVEPGIYRFHEDALEPVKQGVFRHASKSLCLGQSLGGDASALVFLMADLEEAIARGGDRAYRAMLMGAGIAAGRMMVGAYALDAAATGLTFFDDEVRAFLGTHLEPMLAVAVGKTAYRRAFDQAS